VKIIFRWCRQDDRGRTELGLQVGGAKEAGGGSNLRTEQCGKRGSRGPLSKGPCGGRGYEKQRGFATKKFRKSKKNKKVPRGMGKSNLGLRQGKGGTASFSKKKPGYGGSSSSPGWPISSDWKAGARKQ